MFVNLLVLLIVLAITFFFGRLAYRAVKAQRMWVKILGGLGAGVVAAGRVRAGEESDRQPSRDSVEQAALRVETGSVGLPVGVQVAARHWREDVALAVMSALEKHFESQSDYPTRPNL
ncbi:MAG: hypothetical protein HND47_12245 [Chloroflexi bacterium]|nr:hypothetical protein [Chloroflexota bacterium]